MGCGERDGSVRLPQQKRMLDKACRFSLRFSDLTQLTEPSRDSVSSSVTWGDATAYLTGECEDSVTEHRQRPWPGAQPIACGTSSGLYVFPPRSTFNKVLVA